MAVKSLGEHYRCNICGNEVYVIKAGGGILVCCGQEMQYMGNSDQRPIDDEIPV
mgnify:CR=1 FL=1